MNILKTFNNYNINTFKNQTPVFRKYIKTGKVLEKNQQSLAGMVQLQHHLGLDNFNFLKYLRFADVEFRKQRFLKKHLSNVKLQRTMLSDEEYIEYSFQNDFECDEETLRDLNDFLIDFCKNKKDFYDIIRTKLLDGTSQKNNVETLLSHNEESSEYPWPRVNENVPIIEDEYIEEPYTHEHNEYDQVLEDKVVECLDDFMGCDEPEVLNLAAKANLVLYNEVNNYEDNIKYKTYKVVNRYYQARSYDEALIKHYIKHVVFELHKCLDCFLTFTNMIIDHHIKQMQKDDGSDLPMYTKSEMATSILEVAANIVQ